MDEVKDYPPYLDYPKPYKSQTNADCIRSMTDDELNDLFNEIYNAGAEDAVSVVRCRECKYHKDTSITGYEHCCLIGKTVRYNDFCSYGERKEGAD